MKYIIINVVSISTFMDSLAQPNLQHFGTSITQTSRKTVFSMPAFREITHPDGKHNDGI